VGHGGTLDPPASGLLPLVLGRATRLVRFLPGSPKAYEGTFTLGVRTLTDDLAGAVIERHDGPLPDPGSVIGSAAAIAGIRLQIPPAVSARKVGGQRLYRLARRGITVDAPAAEVEIGRFGIQPTEDPAVYRFDAEVSGGTYIRSIVRDLGDDLGCGAALATLRRTRIGPMRPAPELRPAANLREQPGPGRDSLIPLERMPLEPADLLLDDEETASRFRHGRPQAVPPADVGAGFRRVLGPRGELLGIGEIDSESLLARVVIATPEP
jgi:tRNA pseudouridine55 synthase